MLIEQIQITENGLVITVVATHPTATKRRPSSRHDAVPTRMLRCRCRVAPPCWSVEQATGNAPTVDQHWRHWPPPGRRRSGPGSTESVSLGFETRHVVRLCPLCYSGQPLRGILYRLENQSNLEKMPSSSRFGWWDAP